MKLIPPETTFDMVTFDLENPVIDPFVERLNERERLESGHCWVCCNEFDKGSGKILRESDPNCYEIANRLDVCPACSGVINPDAFNFY